MICQKECQIEDCLNVFVCIAHTSKWYVRNYVRMVCQRGDHWRSLEENNFNTWSSGWWSREKELLNGYLVPLQHFIFISERIRTLFERFLNVFCILFEGFLNSCFHSRMCEWQKSLRCFILMVGQETRNIRTTKLFIIALDVQTYPEDGF